MEKSNLKSLAWLDKLSAFAAEREKNPDIPHAELAKALGHDKAMVSFLRSLNSCFDPAAVERVRQAAQGPHPFTLSFNSALELAKLNGKVPDLPGAFQDALEVVLARHLAKRHIKNLVDWIASGKPAKDFDPKKIKGNKQDSDEPETDEDEGDEEEPKEQTEDKKQKKGKGIRKALKQLQKAGAKGLFVGLKSMAGMIHRYVHEAAKTTAGYFCPLHSRSSRNHDSSTRPNLFRFLGHWGLYWFCVFFAYSGIVGLLSYIGHFIPFVGPWIDSAWAFLVHLLIRLPFWLLRQIFAKPWLVFILGVALVWWIHKEFKAGLLATLVVAALLAAGWIFRGVWGPYLSSIVSISSPKTVEVPVSTKTSQPAVPAVSAIISKIEPKLTAKKPKKPLSPVALAKGDNSGVLVIPPESQPRVQQESLFVNGFIGDLFGPSYHDLQGWMGNLQSEITPGYWDQFVYENYPPAKMQEIQDKKYLVFFKLSDPVKCVRADVLLDEFQVEGVVTTKSDLHYQGEVVSTVPVTVIVDVRQGLKGLEVCKVDRVRP